MIPTPAPRVRAVRTTPAELPPDGAHYDVEVDVIQTFQMRVHAHGNVAAGDVAQARLAALEPGDREHYSHGDIQERVRVVGRHPCDSPDTCRQHPRAS